jgi:hypothetical protein
MPAIIPAVVAYGVATLAGKAIIGAIAGALVSAAIGQREQRRAERQQRAAFNASLRDQVVTVKGGVNPRPIVYGRTRVGGQIVYAESFGATKEKLLMVIALAHGEIDAVETVYFNDVPLTIDGSDNVATAPYAFSGTQSPLQVVTVPGSPHQITLSQPPAGDLIVQDITFGTGGGDAGAPPVLVAGSDYSVSGFTVTFNAALVGKVVQISYTTNVSGSYAKVWRYTGAPGQNLSTLMGVLGAPSWTASDQCQGMAALVVLLTFGENIWPTGVPNITAVLRGRRCYDPRNASTVWTQNAALCTRDYLRFQYGVNVADARLDDAGATNASANICDEDVQLTATPTYQDRYTVNGIISTGDDRLANLEKFAQAMAGSVNYSAGKWRIRAGAYTAPALTLTENTLADGDIQIVPYASRRSLINGAKATYINADAGYIEDQAPEWNNAGYIADDGNVALTTALTLPLVTDHQRAQRLSKIAVTRSREQLVLRCRCNFSTYAWQVGDMVSVTLARYGFSAKPFRILERGFSIEGGMAFTLREEPNGLYDWNLGEASVLTGAGNTTLPNPTQVGVPTITGITSAQWLYKAGDGTFVARIRVAVTPPADDYVLKGGKLQLQYKRGDWTGDWALVEADGAATQIWIDPAFDAQNYLIRVRALNSAGYPSAWSAPQIHTCSGRPGQVVNLLANSDWTQELGYPENAAYNDTRSLRGWLLGYSAHSGQVAGRNYDGGRTWNIGRGGAWLFNNQITAGQYSYLYQWVPVVPGVEYEIQVRASSHRQYAYVAINWYNAAQNSVLGSISNGFDAGNTVDGDPYQAATRRKFWAKGVAPAGTAWALFHCLQQNTAATATPGYTFWHQAMMNVAPPGVTMDTATPWVPSPDDTVDGQLQSTYKQAVGDAQYVVTTPGNIGGIVFTAPVTGLVRAAATGRFRGWFYGDPIYIGRGRYWMRVAINYVTVFDSAKCSLGAQEPPGGGYNYFSSEQSIDHIFAVQAGQVVQVLLYGEPDTTLDPGMNTYLIETRGATVVAELTRKV